MKISLHIEAESAEEFQFALSALAVQAVPAAPAVAVGKIIQELEKLEESHAEKAPVKAVADRQESAPAQEPEAEPETAQAAAEEPVKKRKPRGRPRKAAQVETAPAAAPVAESGNGAPTAVTRDDFLAACRNYVISYGINFGQVDVPKLLQPELGDHIRRQVDVEEKDLGKATAIIAEAVNKNPFNRKRANA